MCRYDPLVLACSLLCFWSMLLSLHRPRQLSIVTACSFLILMLIGGPAIALWTTAVWLGGLITRYSFSGKLFWLKKTFGLAGAGLAPLVVATLVTGEFALSCVVAVTLLAAIFTGTALIRVSRKETRVTPIPSFLAAIALWFLLAIMEPNMVLLALIPYVAHGAWLVKRPRPTFKALGKAQSACLLWVAAVILLHVLGKL